MSVFHRCHLARETVSVSCSNRSFHVPHTPHRGLQDIQKKPGRSSRIAECHKRYRCQMKTKQSLWALEIVWKAGFFFLFFFFPLLICWTHVQQQHSSQEGLSLAVANLLVVNRVGLEEKSRKKHARWENMFHWGFKNTSVGEEMIANRIGLLLVE